MNKPPLHIIGPNGEKYPVTHPELAEYVRKQGIFKLNLTSTNELLGTDFNGKTSPVRIRAKIQDILKINGDRGVSDNIIGLSDKIPQPATQKAPTNMDLGDAYHELDECPRIPGILKIFCQKVPFESLQLFAEKGARTHDPQAIIKAFEAVTENDALVRLKSAYLEFFSVLPSSQYGKVKHPASTFIYRLYIYRLYQMYVKPSADSLVSTALLHREVRAGINQHWIQKDEANKLLQISMDDPLHQSHKTLDGLIERIFPKGAKNELSPSDIHALVMGWRQVYAESIMLPEIGEKIQQAIARQANELAELYPTNIHLRNFLEVGQKKPDMNNMDTAHWDQEMALMMEGKDPSARKMKARELWIRFLKLREEKEGRLTKQIEETLRSLLIERLGFKKLPEKYSPVLETPQKKAEINTSNVNKWVEILRHADSAKQQRLAIQMRFLIAIGSVPQEQIGQIPSHVESYSPITMAEKVVTGQMKELKKTDFIRLKRIMAYLPDDADTTKFYEAIAKGYEEKPMPVGDAVHMMSGDINHFKNFLMNTLNNTSAYLPVMRVIMEVL